MIYQPCHHSKVIKKSKRRKRTKNLNSKQTINHTSSIITTNTSWKNLTQVIKRNQIKNNKIKNDTIRINNNK